MSHLPQSRAWRRPILAAGLALFLIGARASAQPAAATPPGAGAQAAAGLPSGRIGFINTERILKESAPALAAQRKLEAEFQPRDKQLRDMAAQMRALNEKLQKDGPVMNAGDRGKLQQELSDLNRRFQRKQREFSEDLNARRNAALAAVLDQANQVVKQVAEQGNYDIIFQDAVYVDPRIDITDKVLKALDAQASPPGK